MHVVRIKKLKGMGGGVCTFFFCNKYKRLFLENWVKTLISWGGRGNGDMDS
jgi:hypothetical protein